MRYIKVEWLGERPTDRDVFVHLLRMLGKLGVTESRLRVDGIIACENAWLNKVRGALALKWQFRVKKISGTKKALPG